MKPDNQSSASDTTETALSDERAIGSVVPTRRDLRAGTALFRQGDASIGLFYLLAGRMRLVRVTPSGSEVALHTISPGEFFAEASLFSSSYHCDAIALGDSVVLIYGKKALIAEFNRNPEDLWQFAGRLARQVQGLRTRLTLRQIRSATERVRQALLLRCDESGFWKTEGTLKQFGAEIGLTHEALYRALARLERSQAIIRLADGIVVKRK
ncbi:MAG TPA: Crp/Fnr family transcriptional regulator [Paucimonas sp.]|nr:Crp/Fnr family transcriptional regulator [Paucimonas sp.]